MLYGYVQAKLSGLIVTLKEIVHELKAGNGYGSHIEALKKEIANFTAEVDNFIEKYSDSFTALSVNAYALLKDIEETVSDKGYFDNVGIANAIEIFEDYINWLEETKGNEECW
ncbi:hypothetical protein [Ectobacillus panaciterrae]|uniref:hypothetical protein n=1 Tax=Ectobacillus panaciterrae TaxID=363872 RepID=UPI0003F8D7BA|nr:hypothetical protein [Ectobacillus panaciterrae]